MHILNLYYSQTGNTEKIALRIAQTAESLGHTVVTLQAAKELAVDLLAYDFIFIGSGVYQWLPGKPMLDFLRATRQRSSEAGHIRPCSPRVAGKRGVVYCTYGGVHTGMSEAVPAVKFCGQLLEHLGITVLDEWYFIGDFKADAFRKHNTDGRFGDITGRPDERDLADAAARVKAILTV
jgi:multimeric flavodoxin WrbA